MTVQRATNIRVSTTSAAPLRGTIEIDCAGTVATFAIDEEMAHRLCADLERFLTQVPRRTRAAR
ncbi:thiamine phosphate synthase YjbQ (UPF0047 family) [Bradyrhizobium sp. USDA 4524]|uniref:hypothetical protein n=1 Tax=unclassified Bradyrhizobium TaxID=2631580 RepID=UPI00209F5828|nr:MULTISPECIES: hypothetical protein [unclassified Bradyrhizobium]MCP1844879.1 thiamine phosphate synthase YjbQ (UPF0047 family) [Bradyrhizobium sp. USDA 4538]MCP1905444.1 thiamine phosphate synthase YjbQ (UPF0047 family) [Bradyrhizobium sp. USDA 4537]MCP1988900.1 thiamine phosphate synthase YjbQ (UPF0047 family) [Bradyrhizobium sp. USDA 4539]